MFTPLCQLLIKNRIRPYYLFHPKAVKGTAHFACSINDGLRVIQGLRGFTSGLAIPTYVYNAPGGLGKISLYPNYVVSHEEDGLVLRTWEGQQVYPLPPGKRTCLCSGRTRCDPAKQTRSSQSGTEA